MAAANNVTSASGSQRRSSSNAASRASKANAAASGGSNVEGNSSEASSGSFGSTITTEGVPGRTGAVSSVGSPQDNKLRRSPSGGKNKKRFVGVRQRPSGRWVAEIKDTTQKIRLWLGTFDTAEDAARAYDEAAWLLRGANTRTNFVPSAKSDPSVLPSKAARLLQLRRNGSVNSNAESNASIVAALNCKQQQRQQSQQQQSSPQVAQSTSPSDVSLTEERASPITVDSLPRPVTPAIPPGDGNSVVSSQTPFAVDMVYDPETFSAGASPKSGTSYSEEVEELCADSPCEDYNARSCSNLASCSFQDESMVNIKQEHTYCTNVSNSGAIREIRKEKDYCAEAAPQDNFVEDTDMSSGLSGLDEVDLSCVDSVYTSGFDFSSEMVTGLEIENLISDDAGSLSADIGSCQLPFSCDDSLLFTEQVRRMMDERQVSADLYSMNGLQECLSVSGPSCFGMSSPSLTLPSSYKSQRSQSGGYLLSSPGWKVGSGTGTNANGWPTKSGSSPGSTNTESADFQNQEAMWSSWDLPPLCVVA